MVSDGSLRNMIASHQAFLVFFCFVLPGDGSSATGEALLDALGVVVGAPLG